ncbi:MAG TPA: lipoyl synthase, partial [Flavobacteriales bacterium]|nr:lipoyl synthase [Flavobacteriales bacterium]
FLAHFWQIWHAEFMSTKLQDIAVVVTSGKKYTTPQGFTAIKDGIPTSRLPHTSVLPKPPWLKIKLPADTRQYKTVQKAVHEHQLSTVCEEAKCPNISECWSHGTATLMLMGSVCTRACRFCSVDTGNPKGWLDLAEPEKAATTVALMQLEYVVLTSVDRDDLPDGGATHYANTIRAIKEKCPQTKVEALTPDFQGDKKCVNIILDAGTDVFAQNVETVERLTHPVRDPKAGYWQTIHLLAHAKKQRNDILTKTSLMLGLGETKTEILKTMDELRDAKVDVLTLGQYLQPTTHHLPVERFVTPEEFTEYREIGLAKGFFEVAAGPFVRSSYRADRIFKKNNLDM